MGGIHVVVAQRILAICEAGKEVVADSTGRGVIGPGRDHRFYGVNGSQRVPLSVSVSHVRSAPRTGHLGLLPRLGCGSTAGWRNHRRRAGRTLYPKER